MAYYLVTGGCGFIGSHLVEALVQKGERVRVFDNCSTGKAKNIAHVKNQIELVDGDLRELDTVHQAVAGVDYVFPPRCPALGRQICCGSHFEQ